MLQGVLDGRFQIEHRIPASNGGDLYTATDLETGDRVAVKVLRPGASESNESLARRLQEFRLLRNMNHRNSVQVIQTGLCDNNLFYAAMEYITGRTLSQIVMEDGPISAEKAADYLDQLADVLDKAHAAGIIHRGIKPGNIVIQQDEQGDHIVKLMGFVSAKVLSKEVNEAEKLTQAGTTIGTPAYMSPEQAMGRRITKLSDIYSAGVTLYAVLTGSLPFDEKNDVKTLMAHVKAPIPAFAQKNPQVNVPLGVERVVRQAMAKEPAYRPMSVGELARMFREAVTYPDRLPTGLRDIPEPPTGSHPAVPPQSATDTLIPSKPGAAKYWALAVVGSIAAGILIAFFAAH